MPEKIVIHWDLHDRKNKLLSNWKSYNHTAKKKLILRDRKKHTVYLSEYVKSNSDSFGSKDIPASLIINLT